MHDAAVAIVPSGPTPAASCGSRSNQFVQRGFADRRFSLPRDDKRPHGASVTNVLDHRSLYHHAGGRSYTPGASVSPVAGGLLKLSGFTARTEHFESRSAFSAVLPMRTSRKLVRPRVPNTIRSAPT